MTRRQRIALQAVLAVIALQIIMNVLYLTFPVWALTLYEWNLLVISADTSFLALYYAIYAIWHYDAMIDRAKEEVKARVGSGVMGKLGNVLEKADRRFMELNPKQREKLIRLLDRGIDYGFAKLEEIGTRPPGFNPPKGLKVKRKRK